MVLFLLILTLEWLLELQQISGQFITVCWFANCFPYADGKERLKKEVDHSRLVGGRFNKQVNLHMRLVLGSCNMSRSLHSPARILKVYTEALTGFSHIFSPDGLNNTLLSQCFILENISHCGNSGQNAYSKDRGGDEQPPVACAQPPGQPAVMSSQWSLQHSP